MRKLIASIILVLFLTCCVAVPQVFAKDTSSDIKDIDVKKNKLIGYMLSKQLPTIHFSDKKMDDTLAEAIFDLYLKQLDYQKRFLLQSDVDNLTNFAPFIDDNLSNGRIILPEAGFDILGHRIKQVEELMKTIFSEAFDINSKELYETDSEKNNYVKSLDELKERWRKSLKAQVISRYIDLLEENEKKDKAVRKSDKDIYDEAIEKVRKRNEDFFVRLHQETLQDHFDSYFSAVTHAFDPHTNYMAPAKKEDFDISMRGSLEGIGALLKEDGGYIKVVSIMAGSASSRQGQLGAEDCILQVAEGEADPVEITDMRLKDAVRLIRGPKGTEVRLTVKKPDGTTIVIPIVRDVVQIEETFVKSTVLEDKNGKKTGYIFLPSFYRDFEKSRDGKDARNSTTDTRLAIEKLMKEDIQGLILDLRNNGGGSLFDAVDTSGLFIDNGPVVQVKNSYGQKRILEDTTAGSSYSGPLVVLVNQFSASASEILAAAMQDYNRAIIVGGKHTHGKGTVQTVIDLNENIPLLHLKKYDNLGALKVTIQKFYRVNGGSTQYRGVEPDIVLPSLLQHLESGEQYLDYSLKWDQVEPVAYNELPASALKRDKITKQSNDRVQNDSAFNAIATEAARSLARKEDTNISLAFEDMLMKRQEQDDARKKLAEVYSRFKDEDEDEDEKTDENLDEEAKNKRWLKELDEDPYIIEAIRILRDLAHPE